MASWQWFTRENLRSRWPAAAIAGVVVLVFLCGLVWHHASLLGVGAALLCLLLRRAGKDQGPATAPPANQRSWRAAMAVADDEDHSPAQETSRPAPPAPTRAAPALDPSKQLGTIKNTDDLVDELLATGRYALLLRPETKQHLTQAHVLIAVRHLDEAMVLVPAGRVLLGQLAEQASSACGAAELDPKLIQRNMVEVEPAYLDRFCVTNEQYQQFVDAGGYEQLGLWHEEALPAVLDFVDRTGAPGPRYWSDGHYESGAGRLPVVGVSWYEACAYACWVGKRLPTDAEWTKAGAWPVEAAPGRIAQRRYPWGESFDVRRAHLYGSGQLQPVAVDEYPGGMSVGGVHQLIGNVWEWTATPLAELGDPTLHVSESVASIRGGAFDTYFENQATCHYQSGEQRLSRRPNIGFRLALAMSDLDPHVDSESAYISADSRYSEPADEPAAVTC
jgi:iron(II)-dependent oxidoreductase